MKTFVTFIGSLFAMVSTICAQNLLINFYPDNQPYPGLKGYPAQIMPVPWSTNTPGWSTNMTSTDFETYMESCRVTYLSSQSNAAATVQAKTDANLARLLVLYGVISPARNTIGANQSSLTNIYASLASGTNTTAQVVSRVNQANLLLNDQMTIMSSILEFLQRLGPSLQSIYKPADDTTP